MKIASLFLLSVIISASSFGQDGAWKDKSLNQILSFKLPANAMHDKSSFVDEYAGYVNDIYFGFQYIDTVFSKPETQEQFKGSLSSFLEDRHKILPLANYKLNATPASFGGTKGILAEFTNSDPNESYKQVFYYITMANDHIYCFYGYSTTLNENKEQILSYFRSIRFDVKKTKEARFHK